VKSLLHFGVSPHTLNNDLKSQIDILKALDIRYDVRIENLIRMLEQGEKKEIQADSWRFKSALKAGIDKGW
jgi:hypothetical protein